jgi:Ca-activated chloride channel family protein
MSRAVTVLGLFFAMLLPAAPQRQQPYSLSVNVDLVVLNVRVSDKYGQAVTGLAKEAFRIEEDGKPQPISLFSREDGPATIGLVLDSSASINHRQSEIRSAALRFVRSRHPQDQFFVLQFNRNLYWTLPEDLPFTDDLNLLRQALEQTPAGGRTALYDAVAAAIEHAGNGAWDKRAIIVLTDGGDNASRKKLNEVLQLAQESNVTIYTIGLFDPLSDEVNPSALRRLAYSTGGETYKPAGKDDLLEAWEKISKGIWSQYTIGYTPSQRSLDGAFHKIHVRVDAAGLKSVTVQTRPGYRARRAETEP